MDSYVFLELVLESYKIIVFTSYSLLWKVQFVDSVCVRILTTIATNIDIVRICRVIIMILRTILMVLWLIRLLLGWPYAW